MEFDGNADWFSPGLGLILGQLRILNLSLMYGPFIVVKLLLSAERYVSLVGRSFFDVRVLLSFVYEPAMVLRKSCILLQMKLLNSLAIHCICCKKRESNWTAAFLRAMFSFAVCSAK